MIKRFDQDGDGQLNEAERQTAREKMRHKWAAKGDRRGAGDAPRAKMRRSFDRDGDGRLNQAEKQQARKFAKKLRHKMQHRMMSRMWAARLHPWRAQGGQSRPHAFRGPRGAAFGPKHSVRQAKIQRFDQDQDGKLSEAERGEARKAAEARRIRAQENRRQVLARFDGDGDGRLGEAERKSMRETWQKFIEQQPPVSKK